MHHFWLLGLIGLTAAQKERYSDRPFENRPFYERMSGLDISGNRSSIDWKWAIRDDQKYVYIKSTVGEDFLDPWWETNWDRARQSQFMIGSYHIPDGRSSAAKSASNFYNKAAWRFKSVGMSLPGMLKLEGDCSVSEAWMKEFSDKYRSYDTVYPVLSSTPEWWKKCVGDTDAFSKTHPLMMVCYRKRMRNPCKPQGNWTDFTLFV